MEGLAAPARLFASRVVHRSALLMRLLDVVAIATISMLASGALAQSTQRIRGDIVSVEGQKLEVRTRTGEIASITLADQYKVSAVVKSSADAIVPGAYVGTASMPQADGTARALEVVVFPESGRGSGEGHYPWDLKPGSMMTNATVAEVANVENGRRITLKYKDGEKTIDVPSDAPIVTFEPGSREMLRAGAHVMLNARIGPDGSLSATGVAVGKDGLVPPM
jgi:hypothetical protein